MHIMMLSANTGEGHNSSAKAIMEVLQARGVSCEIVDCLAFLSPGFSKFICDWHVRIYQHTPGIFDKGYRLMENTANSDSFSPICELLSLGAGKLYARIMEQKYDAVVCVHPFAGVMITEVRRGWELNIPTMLVATDYTCSPTVEQCEVDAFCIPHPLVREEFTQAGIPEKNQFVCGIPVRQVFYEPAQRAQARAELGLPQEGTVVLVMCGSMGLGPIQSIAVKTLEQMPEESVMVAVCARNEKLREEMNAVDDPRLRVLGFIDNFPRYLEAADLLITKPGGLSSTEAANKHIPMVFINMVGGCESRNFDLFLKKGYAVGSNDPEETVRIAIRMTWDQAGRERIRENLARDFCTNTGVQIADKIMELASR